MPGLHPHLKITCLRYGGLCPPWKSYPGPCWYVNVIQVLGEGNGVPCCSPNRLWGTRGKDKGLCYSLVDPLLLGGLMSKKQRPAVCATLGAQ